MATQLGEYMIKFSLHLYQECNQENQILLTQTLKHLINKSIQVYALQKSLLILNNRLLNIFSNLKGRPTLRTGYQ